MAQKKFSSPREEALDIAIETRKGILGGKRDTASVLRACLVIADNLNKTDDGKWLMSELSGYRERDEIPWYRNVYCPIETDLGFRKVGDRQTIVFDVHYLSGILQTKEAELAIVIEDSTDHYILQESTIRGLQDKIVDRCLFFLNDTISELQYGGIVEYLMEEIRKNTDEKLAKLDRKLTDETQSLYVNLTSTNPADWNKVAHSCRKILKLLADKVFPPREESYQMKDGRIFEVGDPNFINRLCSFLDQKISGEERKFLMAEIGYLESYLRQVVEYDQMGEHKPSIEKFHANMMAIHTYLVISEIMKHVS